MVDCEQEPDSPEAKIEKASEHLKAKKEYEKQANELVREAKNEIAEQINSILDDDKKTVKVDSQHESTPPHVVVTISDESMKEVIEHTVSDATEVGSLHAQKFAIGTNIPAQCLSKTERTEKVREIIDDIQDGFEKGAPVDEVITRATMVGMERGKAKREIEELKVDGEVYEPRNGHLRTT